MINCVCNSLSESLVLVEKIEAFGSQSDYVRVRNDMLHIVLHDRHLVIEIK